MFPEHIPISLTPNYNSNITLISITDENGCSNTTINAIPIIVNQFPNLNLQLTDICSGTPSFNFPIDSVNEGTPLGGNYFIENICKTYKYKPFSISDNNYLLNYDWPGNVRELRNLVERASILAKDEKNFKNTIEKFIK